MKKVIWLSFLLVLGFSHLPKAQILSSEVISNAEAYLNFDWTANPDNIWNQESCGGKSVNTPFWVTVGDQTAMPYCWGGNSTLSDFTAYLPEGKSAGDDNTAAGYGAEPNCAIGVDCSGFVSRCCGLGGHFSTSMINVNELFGHHDSYDDLREADMVNNPGSHVRLVTQINANGTITVIESGSGVGNVGGDGLWRVFNWTYNMSQLSNYNPQYYTGMTTGTAILDCAEAVPLTCGESYHGSSSDAPSQIGFYGCNSWTETGPERVHTITPELDGTIAAEISNFSGDLDVYILGSCDPADCLGVVTSNDAVYADVQAGHTYYIVVDSDDGSQSAYDLVVECFTSEDISVSGASVSPTALNPGQTIDISVDHNYAGSRSDAELPDFVVEYYLSIDCVPDSDDIFLGADTSELGNNQLTMTESEVLTIPEQTMPGNYFLIFAGDAAGVLNEENEINNLECIAVEVLDPNDVNDPVFQQQVIVFPNPTKDVIHIQTTADQVIHKLIIYDVLGRKVKELEKNNLNKLEIRELSGGQYFLEVIGSDHKKAMFKILKQ